MLPIPFYPNTKDNSHCVQACLKMALKYYFPERNYGFAMLDKATNHKNNQWTWDTITMLFLASLNFQVQYYASFNNKKFAEQGEKYLKAIWSSEVFKEQKKHSNFKQEQNLIKKELKNSKITSYDRPATMTDVKRLFTKHYTIFAAINPYILDREKGYSSHLVVITAINSKTITFHDPGIPPIKNRIATLTAFKKGLCYPDKESATIIAFKPIA